MKWWGAVLDFIFGPEDDEGEEVYLPLRPATRLEVMTHANDKLARILGREPRPEELWRYLEDSPQGLT